MKHLLIGAVFAALASPAASQVVSGSLVLPDMEQASLAGEVRVEYPVADALRFGVGAGLERRNDARRIVATMHSGLAEIGAAGVGVQGYVGPRWVENVRGSVFGIGLALNVGVLHASIGVEQLHVGDIRDTIYPLRFGVQFGTR